MTLKNHHYLFKAILLLGVALTTAKTFANPDYVRAWAWASYPTYELNKPYTAISNYSQASGFKRNSNYPFRTYYSGKTSITRTDTGVYKVFFENMTSYGGTVHVTAYGGNHRCNVLYWERVSNGQNVHVRCFSPAGNLQNGNFAVMYYKDGPKGDYYADGYLWASRPTEGSYIPPLSYQANASDLKNEVARSGTGTYRVYMPGMNIESSDRIGGTVMVTSYGWTSNYCKVSGWAFTGSQLYANVNCFNANGNKADTQFTFSFMKEITNGISVAEDRWQGAYVWANRSPDPSPYYQTSYSNQPIERHDIDVGRYQVEIPGLERSYGTSHVKVTAYGSDNRYCNISGWRSSAIYETGTRVDVLCFDANGNAANTKFTLQFFLSEGILF